MSTTSTLLSIAGLAVGAYGVYYLYTNGYIDKILSAIKIPSPGGGNSELYPGEAQDEASTAGGTPAPDASGKCPSGKVLCPDGKCETQAECDKEAKCKSGTSYDPSTKKCVKAARAQIMSRGYVAAYRGWQPMRERITVG